MFAIGGMECYERFSLLAAFLQREFVRPIRAVPLFGVCSSLAAYITTAVSTVVKTCFGQAAVLSRVCKLGRHGVNRQDTELTYP